MPQAIASTTVVRTAVAKLEFTPATPILAKMEVNAAKTEEPNANSHYIAKTPSRFAYARQVTLHHPG